MRLLRPGRFEVVAAVFLAATVVAAVRSTHGYIGEDFRIFADAGTTMLSGAWRHTYADALVQAGPLQLALASLLRGALGGSTAALAVVSDLLVAGALVAGTAAFAGRRPLPLALVAAAAIPLGLVTHPFSLGHFAEPAGALLWLLAARDARQGRVLRAGLLVGASAGFELWGILGVAVLALAPRLRDAARGAALAGSVLALLLAPFVLGGDFHMFDHRWVVTGGAIHLLLPHLHAFPWPLRVLQAAVTVAVAGGLARAIRGSAAAVFVVPAAAAFVRLALDPMSTFYYWDTPLVIDLLGAAAALAQLGAIRTWAGARAGRAAAAA